MLCGQTGTGEELHQETLEKLWGFPATESALYKSGALDETISRRKTEILSEVNRRNRTYFEVEIDKLDNWADGIKVGLEQKIKNLDQEIREVRRTAKVSVELDEQLNWQKCQRELENQRNHRCRELYDRHDEVDSRREKLIIELEHRMELKVIEKHRFSISWQI